ncbi:MAG: carboxypeptidase-like regulatory domain-containing protein [Ignavibacteriales bacterium]|nr:carboxypeptidase-like regulatory domain-containing protein [Ignavibacteriales bacterium]
MSQRFRTYGLKCITILLFLTALHSSYAQKGKISGTVFDDQLNDPLIGVNVFIEGTTTGATTDPQGRFVIININPGKYSVTASMVGFARVTVSDVRVSIDRTTEINFRLKDESIQIEQIIIKAEKPKIVKDRTSSSTTIEDEQIKAAPIEGLRGAMDLSASFEKNEKGDYSVRGSGSNEVQFMVNGVTQSTTNTSIPGYGGAEKADNSWKFDVNPLGIQQIQLITGGFSAEYGNAQAGVVNVALKEGGQKFNGEVRMEYRPAGQYHYGPYIYDQSNFEWQRWGNLDYWFQRQNVVLKDLDINLYNKMYVYNTATLQDSLSAKKEIEWAHKVWVDNHSPSEENPLGVYDYRDRAYKRYLIGFGGPLGKRPDILKFYFSGEYRSNPTRLPTPEKDQVYQNYILNVTATPLLGHKFQATGTFQKYRGGLFSGSSDIRWAGLNSVAESGKYHVYFEPVRTEQTVSGSFKWVYTITNTSFLETNVSHQNEKYELPYLYLVTINSENDRLDSLGDPQGVVLKRGIWWESSYFRQLEAISTNFYQDYRAKNYNLKADYTNQVTQTNLLKAGMRLNYWDVFNNGVNSSFRANSYVAHYAVAEYYRAFPLDYSFYIQDKMEYEGMVANLGLRIEGYNFQSNQPLDRFSPFYQGTQGPGYTGSPLTKSSEWKSVILPRLGISFPIGENTAFRIQYGHFASMPAFTQALTTKTFSGWSAIGNPDLEPKKTINYEFGLQQVIESDFRIDAVLYYNDRVSQIDVQNIAALTGDLRNGSGYLESDPLYLYQSYANNAFGSTIGFELTFEKINIDRWTYRLSYNLSHTTRGRYGSSVVFPDELINLTTREATGEFLSESDRTHNFRGMVQYFLRDKEGIEFLGIKLFENSVFSISYTAKSGIPFTYPPESALKGILNNRRYPLESNFDFNFNKNIMIDDYKIIVGLRIMNLFDNKWLTPMDSYNEQDNRKDWVEKGVTVDNPGIDPTRKSYLLYQYRAYRNVPRQIYFTLGFGF